MVLHYIALHCLVLCCVGLKAHLGRSYLRALFLYECMRFHCFSAVNFCSCSKKTRLTIFQELISFYTEILQRNYLH